MIPLTIVINVKAVEDIVYTVNIIHIIGYSVYSQSLTSPRLAMVYRIITKHTRSSATFFTTLLSEK